MARAARVALKVVLDIRLRVGGNAYSL